MFGTGVPLLLAIDKTMLREIEALPGPHVRRKSSERKGSGGVYRYNTGSESELVDIGVQRVRMPPGLFCTSEAQCHADSQ
jgi:hypothetical protein